jgi:hypothetical protein
MRFLLAVLILAVPIAWAAPPENADPALSPWFQSLHDSDGHSCCSLADCRPVDARQVGDGYEVLIGKEHELEPPQWIAVPPDKVLSRIPNPVGRAVVCWSPYRGVMCFVRATEA